MGNTAAIILAGGRGSRMQSEIPKQYMLLAGKPLLYYSLKAFEESPVDQIVLVTGKGEEEYCRDRIIVPYGFQKIVKIVNGGTERYHSVYEGLRALSEDTELVLIHDGARPLITPDIIADTISSVRRHGACVVGVPSKDTVKITGADGHIESTPDRDRVWIVQTPQAFRYDWIREAYDKLFAKPVSGITDDAMVLERMSTHPVYMVKGSYTNIKITTPEDICLAEGLLQNEKNMKVHSAE